MQKLEKKSAPGNMQTTLRDDTHSSDQTGVTTGALHPGHSAPGPRANNHSVCEGATWLV